VIKGCLSLFQMKKASHTTKTSSSVHATKKLFSNGARKATPLKFKQISEGELNASRNSAYSYLVK